MKEREKEHLLRQIASKTSLSITDARATHREESLDALRDTEETDSGFHTPRSTTSEPTVRRQLFRGAFGLFKVLLDLVRLELFIVHLDLFMVLLILFMVLLILFMVLLILFRVVLGWFNVLLETVVNLWHLMSMCERL